MPDPFEALRTAPTPIDPEPAFAARLRARVARALSGSPQGESTHVTIHTEPETSLRQGDMSYHALWVPDVDHAARFYADVLGWHFAEPNAGPYRQVEGLSLSQGITQLSGSVDFMRDLGVPIPEHLQPTGYTVFVVDDLVAATERVRAAGGWAGEPKQQPYGLVSACVDDQGLVFSLHEVPAGMPAPRPPATGAAHGDLAFVLIELPDGARGRAFYSSVLGVQFQPGRVPDHWAVADSAPMTGLGGGYARASVVPMYRVDDIRQAVQRVRAAGGTATEPVDEGYGFRATCADDQGVRFSLGQLRGR